MRTTTIIAMLLAAFYMSGCCDHEHEGYALTSHCSESEVNCTNKNGSDSNQPYTPPPPIFSFSFHHITVQNPTNDWGFDSDEPYMIFMADDPSGIGMG